MQIYMGFQSFMADWDRASLLGEPKPKKTHPAVDDVIEALLLARALGLRGDSSLILSLTDSQMADATVTGFEIKIDDDNNYMEIQCKHPEIDEFTTIGTRERYPEVRSE